MRICQNCGRENPLERDFCECGEYLRWEPTNYQMPTVQPPPPAEKPVAPPPAEETAPASTPSSAPADAAPPAAPAPGYRTQVRQPAVSRRAAAPPPPPPPSPPPPPINVPPPPPLPAAPPPPPSDSAAITLRLPDDQPSAGAGPLGLAVVPGERVRVLALVRNQSQIVDNYELVVHGFPREWWTVTPDAVYLVPFGSAGAYEQEVEIVLHPPRTPEAEARRWELQVGVISRAQRREVAAAPFTLGILPFEEYALHVRPERASGRRHARYDVRVVNKANAVVLVALDAADSDGECSFRFDAPAIEVSTGSTRTVGLRVEPPRQIWIGRPIERRFELVAASGSAGEQLLEARHEDDDGGGAGRLGQLAKIAGVTPPKVGAPKVAVGAGGIKVKGPHIREPNVRGPQAKAINLARPTLGLRALKRSDGGGAAAAPAPLLPRQAIFRQKAWLPWWLAIVAPLLALLALMLFLLLPKNVTVPDVVGSKTVFDAEKKLVAAGLQLQGKEPRAAAKEDPGTVLGQSLKPGTSVKKGSPVSLEFAAGDRAVVVPKLAGLTLADADKLLRKKGLQKGALSPQPADPAKDKIASTIPAAGESVKEGTPIDIFYPDPEAAKAAKKGGGAAAGGAAGGAAGAGAGAKDIEIPKVDPTDQQGYAAVLSKAGLVPGKPQPRIDAAKRGTVVGTDPVVGTKVAKGATVTMLVSAGFPRMAFDDNKNILLVDGATGKRLTPAIAKTSALEKDATWAADGASVVYTADGRLMSADMVNRDRAARQLRPAAEQYSDPSFAPIATRSVLAVSRINGNDRDLCVGRVKLDGFSAQCIGDDRFTTGFAHWSPDGKTILVPAQRNSDKSFGIVRYKSKRAFSARKEDWGKGKFVTPLSPGNAVIDAAVSPDGKRLAAVANIATPAFQLYVTTPDDLLLRKAKPLIAACKVVWIDSQILALVKFGTDCQGDVGEIDWINVAEPTKITPLAPSGDNPTFEPLSAGG